MRTVTTEDRCYATNSVQALNSGDVREHSAFVADDVDEQPRNGTGILAIYAGTDFACHPAAIAGFPCRSG